MKCPFCDFQDSKVVDSRPAEEGSAIRRRRECVSCGKRFTTYEKVENLPIIVIKKGNMREQFDRDKIMNGIVRACEKRPVTTEEMIAMVDAVESNILNSMDREVTSAKIGEMVMQELKETDEVAYVRFASVYRQFTDINTFISEIEKLLVDRQK
jgi:transcriptional repressor NrdR